MLRLLRRLIRGDSSTSFERSAKAFYRSRTEKDPLTGGEVVLPEDLYAQPDTQTGWWYYTGHCETESKRRFGFEYVFFRRRTDHDRIGVLPLRYLANPMYAAHFAITDKDNDRFAYSDRRGSEGLLGFSALASDREFRLEIGDWYIRGDDESQKLNASMEDLTFTANIRALKPAALNGHGDPAEPGPNGSSRHFSFTRMKADGTIRFGSRREKFRGTAWMDREYGTWFQRHWDWFSIQLEEGSELMLYVFRDERGLPAGNSHGNFIEESGACRKLASDEFTVRPKRRWESPRTGIEYPSGWSVSVPSIGIELEIEPVMLDQELNTSRSTMVVYWEGACEVRGSVRGRNSRGNAYVELVGYDDVSADLTPLSFISGMWRKGR